MTVYLFSIVEFILFKILLFYVMIDCYEDLLQLCIYIFFFAVNKQTQPTDASSSVSSKLEITPKDDRRFILFP